MKNLKKISDVVTVILKECPEARNSDRLLTCKVYEHFGVDLNQSFESIMMDSELPPIETIGRARRKAQENNSELRATDIVEQYRASNEEYFKEFARS